MIRTKISLRDTKESKTSRYNYKSCQVCQYIDETIGFEDAGGNKYDIYCSQTSLQLLL